MYPLHQETVLKVAFHGEGSSKPSKFIEAQQKGEGWGGGWTLRCAPFPARQQTV